MTVDNWIQVTGDQQADDLVVVEGNERLRPGQLVKIKETISDSVE